MVAMNFPNTPTINQVYQPGSGLPAFQWNGAAWINVGAMPIGRIAAEVKSSAYTVVLGDLAKLFLVSGSWTLSLPAAATAAAGFVIRLRNVGTGVITLDPSGSETINSRTTVGLYPGESTELICDGTGWHALFQSQEVAIAKSPAGGTASTMAELVLDLPAEFRKFRLDIDHLQPISGSAEAFLRFYQGGVMVTTGYTWFHHYASAAPGYYTQASGGPISAGGISLSSGANGNSAFMPNAYVVDIFPGDSGTVPVCPSLSFQGSHQGYANYGEGSLQGAGQALRADKIRLGLAGPITIAAGLKYALTGDRA